MLYGSRLEVAAAISGEFHEEFLLMATMRNVPHISGDIVSVRPLHSMGSLECPLAR